MGISSARAPPRAPPLVELALGRVHEAQGQHHRFLTCLGGYSRSVNSSSYGASEVLLPRIVGSLGSVISQATSWAVIELRTDLVVCFGCIPL